MKWIRLNLLLSQRRMLPTWNHTEVTLKLTRSQYLPLDIIARQSSSKPILKTYPGRYNDLHIDLAAHKFTGEELFESLSGSLKSWRKEGVSAVWVKIPLEQSALIHPAAQLGFTYHHAKDDYCMMCQWLAKDRPSKLHHYASHRIGAGGFVLNEERQEVLLVREKKIYPKLWKFPGGLSEIGEDIGDTAVREVKEETGIDTEFQSILTFRQQHDHPGAFGVSDIYCVCRLRATTFHIAACREEIGECRWLPLADVESLPDERASLFTKRVVALVRHGMRRGFPAVDITAQWLESVVRGNYFRIYHRPLGEDG